MVGYCPICGKPVYFGEKKRSLGRDYHPLCLKCQRCNRQLTPGQHAEYDEKPYCPHCYLRMFGPRGNRKPGGRRRKEEWMRVVAVGRPKHILCQQNLLAGCYSNLWPTLFFVGRMRSVPTRKRRRLFLKDYVDISSVSEGCCFWIFI
ncbi:hypothetical protein NQZ68_031849 [Dissostichus eleginoides]|nr:hypothetical protein NQZ68_031849 [Dissostichus eleginoides]